MPKAPVSTQPLAPPSRASSTDLPWRTSSWTMASVLKMDGWPKPVLTIFRARFRKRSGVFLLIWTMELGWSRRISSITSRIRKDRSLTPSAPSVRTPPVLIRAKSV